MNRSLIKISFALCALPVFGAYAQTRPPRRSAPQTQTPKPSPAVSPAQTNPTTLPAAKPDEDCGCDAGPLPGVLATVNGVKITSADLSPEVEQQVRELEKQVVEARKREVDLQINSKLLEAEAKRRGSSPDKILADEVVTKATRPTDAEAQAFFDLHKAQLEAQLGHAAELKDVKDDLINSMMADRQAAAAKSLADRLRAAAQVKLMATDVTPPANAAGRARVFATVNGESITSGQIEDSLRPLVAQAQERIYQLRQHDLDTRINDALLQQEAQKRQVTPQALLQTEVTARTQPVTEAEAQTFYNANKERINGEYAQIKEKLIQYLKDQQGEQATAAYADQLRRTATILTFLKPPVSPAYDIATDDQPVRGGQNAKVTIVEFTDFQCPSCAAEQSVLERIMSEYGERVRLVVRDFPLAQHKNAQQAAEAAEAAREQGKYWEYATLLFTQQSAGTNEQEKEAALDVAKLKEYASRLGLDRAKFDAALASGRLAAKVRRDQQDALKIGVNHTPSLYVNGRLTLDNAYETIKAALDAALSGGAK